MRLTHLVYQEHKTKKELTGPMPDPTFHFDADSDPDPTFHFDADSDPDPTFHFDADSDPDPTFHFDADSDPVLYMHVIHLLENQKMY
jgi:hypothetical protein